MLSAALGAPPAVASEEPAEVSEPATITTVLHPGWNMVGWVGPETAASDLFDEIPALASIFAWDSEGGDYRRRARATVHRLDPLMLTPGQGLWLYLDGETSVEWTRAASEDSVLLELPAGRNLVAWAGRDGTPIAEAVERLGERLERVWRWDAEASRYRLYHSPATARTELDHGDALLVELTEDARWWQPGLGPPPVVFLGEFTDERKAEIAGWVDGTQALIAERWGVTAPFTTYVGDREAVAPTYRRIRGSTGVTGCGDYSNSVIFLVDACINGGAHAHEYFHAVQFHLIGQPGKWVPGWMIEGSATYSLILYRGTVSTTPTADERIQEARRQSEAILGYYSHRPPLVELEDYGATVKPGNFGFTLGFLGIAWLAERVGEQSIVDFFVRLADEPSWREAFEATFGLTVDDYYEQFATYRDEAIIPLPHLTDDSDEPALVFVGDVPAQTKVAVRSEFDALRAFFADEFTSGTADYTIFAATQPDEVAAAHRRAFGEEPRQGFCRRSSDSGLAVVIDLNCRSTAPRDLDAMHFRNVRRELAPWESRPSMPAGFADYGPFWLDGVAETYVTYAYRAAVGIEGADDIRSEAVSPAMGVTRPLSSTANRRELGNDYRGASGLGFIALELLAERAGDSALFEYYRLLPNSDSWEDAFEGAFGLTVDDFYEEFEVHRARAAPPFPHLIDDRDEPVLVFATDVPADTEAAVRAELDAVQQWFGRLGVGTADYTVYVGADVEALADAYVRVTGRQPPERFCSWHPSHGAAILNLDCLSAAPYSLDSYHLTAVRDRLAPTVSLPSLPTGFAQRGPAWLREGVNRYMSHAYRVGRGYEDVDASRNRESSAAGRTSRLLSASSTWSGFREESWPSGSLAFLAIEWLAEHAGEAAPFEYYRLLPESGTWDEAFEGAFGLTVDDFYAAFEAHRARVAPPFPHLVDDRDEPVLVFLGDVSAANEAAVRAEFDALRTLFDQRFGVGPADYTLFIGAHRDALVDTHRRVTGTEAPARFCYSNPSGGAGIINLHCSGSAPYALDTSHFIAVRARVAPWLSTPEPPQGFDRRGPEWLIRGSEEYVRHAYRVARGHDKPDVGRDRVMSRVARTTQLLSGISTRSGFYEDFWSSHALSLMALEWLAEQAGDPALFDYYRLLPDSETWEEAFEGAFGIAVDEFYEEFEAYRARVAPPIEGADSS